jgi:hypothetical protein
VGGRHSHEDAGTAAPALTADDQAVAQELDKLIDTTCALRQRPGEVPPAEVAQLACASPTQRALTRNLRRPDAVAPGPRKQVTPV